MGNTLPLPMVAMAGTSYVATSLYLLINPLARHKASPRMSQVPLIAHRGGAGEGYENTILAFKRAVETGAGMLELDVHLTKDGEVVVAHDQQLQRLTGVDQNIRHLDFAQLPLLKPSVSIDFCPGLIFQDDSVKDEERNFPTLSKVLHEFPSTQVNIDLKDRDDLLVEKVNKIIVENNAEERCVWGNFSSTTTELCYSTNPRVGLLFSSLRFVKLYILFYTGLLPFVHIKESHLEIPMPSVFLNEKFRTKDGNVGLARLAPWITNLVDWVLMSPMLFLHLQKRGVTTYLWVLNTEDQFERAFNLGVQGVMTDYPTKLKQFLDKKRK